MTESWADYLLEITSYGMTMQEALAYVFCLNFMQTSETQDKNIIYVTFDRSPRNLLEKLGPLADYEKLTILDCFTYGKGEGSDIFLRFYKEKKSKNKMQNYNIQ